MNIIKEIDYPVRELHTVELFVRQNVWSDGAVGYTVLRASDDEPLQDEDWDHIPSDEEIALHPNFRYWRLSAGHAYHMTPVIGCEDCEAIDPGTWRDKYQDYLDAQ